MTNPPYGVIFDMDGVLVDSYGPHYESWRITAERRGYSLSEAVFRTVFGRTNRAIIPVITGRDLPPEEMDAWGEEKEAVYREILQRHFPVMPGAAALIESLLGDGARLALGSSGPPENVAVLINHLPAVQRFQAVITGRDVRRGKPDPEVFLKAADGLGLPPRNCAVVEDSPAGLEAAHRAGMAAIALAGTASREILGSLADVVVQTLTDLTPAGIREILVRRQLREASSCSPFRS